MFGANNQEKAYLAPFLVFMALLALGQLVHALFEGQAWWVVATPRYWIFPLQTLVCGLLLARGWKHYEFSRPAQPLFTTAIAVLVLAIWIAPQELLGAERRWEGFEPGFFGDGAAYGTNVTVRFIRLVIVVPLLEEIFWRGFLLRYVINDDFTKVPFGTFDWKSFSIVTLFFGLAHFGPRLLAGDHHRRTLQFRRLPHPQPQRMRPRACDTNLLLGIYILRTGQWGFW
jgi:CAAX prenyl protease-like protein